MGSFPVGRLVPASDLIAGIIEREEDVLVETLLAQPREVTIYRAGQTDPERRHRPCMYQAQMTQAFCTATVCAVTSLPRDTAARRLCDWP